jgi:hypothetical protein
MTKANTCAFPIDERMEGGLTKREYFAAMAFQGLCVTPGTAKENAAIAVLMADALIEELNKKEEPK